ncbi:OmpP1/FadL family transporter [Roseivirga pacifica]
MKNFKLIALSMALLCLAFKSNAQVDPFAYGYYQDALRYGQYRGLGSARLTGMAGAGSVLGADPSAAFLNPAGLGMYNRSQLVITPGFNFNTYTTNYVGNTVDNENSGMEFSNFAAIINFNKGDLVPGGWRGGTLAITYNRSANFKRDLQYGAQNNESSIIDAMIDNAYGFFPEELGGIEQIGYDHFLINPIPGAEDLYVSPVEGFPYQNERHRQSGHIDEINISFGGNYNDVLYIGAGLGFVSTKYSNNRVYTESFEGTSLSTFSIDEQLTTSGSGINANFGFIVRPIPIFRFGASITTPTWFNFNEESDAIYNSEWNNYDVANFTDEFDNRYILEDTVLTSLQSSTPIYASNYDLRTPMKVNAGAALFLGKAGFITADIEYADYSNAHVSSIDFSTEGDNNTIDNIYQSTLNVRFGAEFRYSIFKFRAGYARIGDPYADSYDNLDRSQEVMSGGVGLSFRKFFVDAGYSRTTYQSSYQSYSFFDGTGPQGITDNTLNQLRLSVGFNF